MGYLRQQVLCDSWSGYISFLCLLLDALSWATHLTSFSLSSLICKMVIRACLIIDDNIYDFFPGLK